MHFAEEILNKDTQPISDLQLLRPNIPSSVNAAVYRGLCLRLMHGIYQAGQVLGIQELADELQTSTMPVREALRSLVAQKALEPMRSRSVRVPLITPERLNDLKNVRVLMEGQALVWAMPHLQGEKIEALAHLATEIQRSRTDLTSSLELNRQFHFLIYSAAQSPVSLGVIESLWLQSGPYLRKARELCGLGREQVDEHHYALVDALRAKDAPAAKRALERDVAWAFEAISNAQDSTMSATGAS